LPARLDALARIIEAEGADVVLLQEAVRTPHIWADGWLAERLGMASVYARANGNINTIGFEEGPAVLSTFPLGTPEILPWQPSPLPFIHRVALGAPVDLGPCHFWAISTHLSLPGGTNGRQMDQLRHWVKERAGLNMAFIGGDFNAQESSPQVRRTQDRWVDTFRSLHPHADATTHFLRWPWGGTLRKRRLDYIFIKPGTHGWRVIDARHVHPVGPALSDHHIVLTRVSPTTGPCATKFDA
jgi:endonuclease/exonuclease/phosphatase family metal-dependent hydrolase